MENGNKSFQEVIDESGAWWLSGNEYQAVYYQWVCHSYFGMFDKVWDLEIGTPNLGFWGTVRKKCNTQRDGSY
jgi:hypothetical protein